jgi:hypothetical protein
MGKTLKMLRKDVLRMHDQRKITGEIMRGWALHMLGAQSSTGATADLPLHL